MFRRMTEDPIGPLILSLSWPSILSNLVTTFYNLADAYFIGRISTAAEGAIGVAFVVMTLINAVGFFCGQGSGNAMSRYLGERDHESASVMATCGLTLSFALGLVIAVLGHVFLEPLCTVAGSTETIMPYAKTYVSLILIGAPWMAGSLTLNMQLRFEGESMYAMVALVIGSVLNIGMAPLLIFVVGMGIAGAGLAAITCQLISFVLLVAGLRRAPEVRLSPRFLRPTHKLVVEFFDGGIPSMARHLVSGLANTVLNNAARPYGDAAIAALAIVSRITSVGNYIQIGVGQGYQPVCGYNLGARRGDRVREGYFFAMRTAFLVVSCVSVVTFVLAPQLVGLLRDDAEVIAIGTLALRVQSVTLPLSGIAMITNFSLQTMGDVWPATFLGLARLGIVLAPVVVVLERLCGLLGVQVAQSVSDAITCGIAVLLARIFLDELKRYHQ